MQADWIPPEPGDLGVGSDEDQQERLSSEFAGEFDERAEAHRLPGEASVGEDVEREEPGDDAFERARS